MLEASGERFARSALVVGLLFGAFAPGGVEAQLLGRASAAVRGDDDDDDDDYDQSSYDEDDDDYDYDYDEGGSSSLLGSASGAARGARSSPSSSSGGRSRGAPYAAAPLATNVFAAHPYEGGIEGYSRAVGSSEEASRVAARLALEGGYALGGAGRAGVSARVQLPFLLDLSARYSVFVEPLEAGIEMAALGRVGLALRLVDHPNVQLRVGAGVRHFQDGAGGLFGGDGTVAMDVFPAWPVVLSFEGGVGVVGEAIVAQVRASIGFLIDSTEIYAGYDYEGLFAGGQHVDLGGPMLGVRLWL